MKVQFELAYDIVEAIQSKVGSRNRYTREYERVAEMTNREEAMRRRGKIVPDVASQTMDGFLKDVERMAKNNSNKSE